MRAIKEQSKFSFAKFHQRLRKQRAERAVRKKKLNNLIAWAREAGEKIGVKLEI
jgi:hypothetical protein